MNDERLVREKMVFGIPRRSVPRVLEIGGYGASDVDLVTVGTINQHIVPEYTDFRGGWFGLERSGFKQLLFDVGSRAARFRGSLPWLESLYYLARRPAYAHRRKALRRILREEMGIEAPVEFIDHHYCHATAAYFASDFGPDATVLTIDGGGDGISAKAFDVTGGRIRELRQVPSFDSLGAFYSYITQISGFKAGRHEGKITGLSAHGDPVYKDILDSLITFRDGGFVNVGNIFFHSAVEKLRKRLPEGWKREDLAASIQKHSEDLATAFARHWVRETGHADVALAGGLVANVRINQKIHELPEVERCFVFPGMSDCGMGIGAALAGFYDRTPRPQTDTRCLDVVYLGPEYSEEEMEEALRIGEVDYTRPEEVEKEIADLLAKGAVVARFDGRMEFGPRALGNRTILYQPTDPSVNDWLNQALKRTEFMPFAPVVLAEEVDRCFLGAQSAERSARFMTITFDCTEWMKERCPGVVHIDGTARPQIIHERDNPSYYRILREYQARTDLPVLINTSFNLHEEPIVCSPEDAVRGFQMGHLDYLAMGPFLARHPSPIEARVRRDRGATAAALLEAED
jgi:carbamoyltransferase